MGALGGAACCSKVVFACGAVAHEMIVGICRRAACTSLSMPSLEMQSISLMAARGMRAAKGLLALIMAATFSGCLSTEVAVMRKSYVLSLPTVSSIGFVGVRQRWTTRATR